MNTELNYSRDHAVIKTDGTAEHVFERAKLGKAPFRFVGIYEKRGPITLSDGSQCGADGQPMGICEYCGRGIAICCQIVSADGKRFVVGSDCVARTGDAGLVRQFKNSKELREFNRQARVVKAKADKEFVTDAIEKHAAELMAVASPNSWRASDTGLDYCRFMLRCAGAAGLAKVAAFVRRVLKAKGEA